MRTESLNSVTSASVAVSLTPKPRLVPPVAPLIWLWVLSTDSILRKDWMLHRWQPERIDPPDTNNPSYDIRADVSLVVDQPIVHLFSHRSKVWSLGITLVELATGKFPYHDCRTDFEVLTKVIQDDPPSLPPEGNFSPEFNSFVKSWYIIIIFGTSVEN